MVAPPNVSERSLFAMGGAPCGDGSAPGCCSALQVSSLVPVLLGDILGPLLETQFQAVRWAISGVDQTNFSSASWIAVLLLLTAALAGFLLPLDPAAAQQAPHGHVTAAYFGCIRRGEQTHEGAACMPADHGGACMAGRSPASCPGHGAASRLSRRNSTSDRRPNPP